MATTGDSSDACGHLCLGPLSPEPAGPVLVEAHERPIAPLKLAARDLARPPLSPLVVQG
jgi:hypothetical protein